MRRLNRTMEQRRKLLEQIVRFGIVGVGSTLLDYGLMLLFKEILGFHYLLSSTLSYGISLIFNYFASMNYVFEGKEEVSRKKEFLIFTVLCLMGMGFNQLVLWMIVEYAGIDYRVSKVLATGVVMVWNFVTRKIFLEEKRGEEMGRT